MMKKLTLVILFLTLGCENKIANVEKEVFQSTLVRSIENLAEEYRLTSFLWKEGVTSEDVATVTQILYRLNELSIQRLKTDVEMNHSTKPDEQLEKNDRDLKALDKEIKELETLLRSKVDWIEESQIIFDKLPLLERFQVDSTEENTFEVTEKTQDQIMDVTLIGFNPSQLIESPIFTTKKHLEPHLLHVLYESIQEVSYNPMGGRIRFLVHFDGMTYEFHLETVGVLKEKPLFSGQLILYQNEKPIRYGIVKLD